jgi:hypothetical protein
MTQEDVAPDAIFRIANAFKGARVLLSAAELGVFAALAERPLDREALRRRIGIAERGARDFFDALVAMGMLCRDDAGRYGNTPETDRYLDPRKPSYVGGQLSLIDARQTAPWSRLTEALRTGEPQSGERGVANFDAYYSDPTVLENFVRGMTAGSLPAAQAIAARFPWGDYRTFVDIGTAEGCLPVVVAKTHPHLVGVGFDLPAVGPAFERYVREHGLSERLRFHGGDFFKDALPRADVLVMGRVLHNWDLPTKQMLLAKAHEALPPGGALVVYESLIDDERRTAVQGLLASLNMLVLSRGGFDFSGADCIAWMVAAGFREPRVEPLAAGVSMVFGIK